MKQEREIHFIINRKDVEQITQKIMSCGFNFEKKIAIKDIYSDDDNFSLLKSKRGFRERTVDNSDPEYIYKEMKNRKIYEKNMNRKEFIKKTKNLKSRINIIKERNIFNRGKVEIVIDNMGKIGCMLEIECKNGDPKKILKEINFPPKLIERTTLGCNELALLNKLK